MLKEIDFLVRYPLLEAIRSSGSALLDLLDEVCSLDFPPNSGWIPATQDAIADMTGALAAESLPKLDEALQSEFQEAVRLTQHSFDHGDPSPDEIRRACERIRATWSEAKHQDRGWKKTVPFNWPRGSEQELIEAIEEEERGERGDG